MSKRTEFNGFRETSTKLISRPNFGEQSLHSDRDIHGSNEGLAMYDFPEEQCVSINGDSVMMFIESSSPSDADF